MGFARNFAIGQQIAQRAIDTYYDAKRAAEIEAVSQHKPVQLGAAYTEADAEQLHAMANARDENGNPYYRVEANPDGSYKWTANFEYVNQPQNGVAEVVLPGAATGIVRPNANVTEFFGTRYKDGELTPDMERGIRRRRLVDVISKYDPVKGIELEKAISDMEYASRLRPLELQSRELGIKKSQQDVEENDLRLSVARRAQEFSALLPEYMARVPLEKLPEIVKDALPNYSRLSFSTDKDGLPVVNILNDNGDVIQRLGGMQLRMLAGAVALANERPEFAMLAMETINNTSKSLGDMIKSDNDLMAKVFGGAVQREQLANARDDNRRGWAQLGLQERRLARQEQLGRDAVAFENAINGVLEGYQAAMADGNTAAADIYAREYDQLRAVAAQRGLKVPPNLKTLTTSPRSSAASAPQKVPDEGARYRINGVVHEVDSAGNFIPLRSDGVPLGVPARQRLQVLKAAKIPDEYIGSLLWTDDGTGVIYGTTLYGVNELDQLRKRIDEDRAAARLHSEGMKARYGAAGYGDRVWYRDRPPVLDPAALDRQATGLILNAR